MHNSYKHCLQILEDLQNRLELSGKLMFCSAVVSNDAWLHKADTSLLLKDLSVLIVRDAP